MKIAQLEDFSEAKLKLDVPITLNPLKRMLRGSSMGPMATANTTRKSIKDYLTADNFLIPFAKQVKKERPWIRRDEFVTQAMIELVKQSKLIGIDINENDAHNLVEPGMYILEKARMLVLDYQAIRDFKRFSQASTMDEALAILLEADALGHLQSLLLDPGEDAWREGVTYEYLQKHVIPAFRKHGLYLPRAIFFQLEKLLQDLARQVVEYLTTCFTKPDLAPIAAVAIVARE
jgi:hypothetical protein